MRYFVDQQSIVRQIWGKADTILFIFAGASAEFALNKAVDWLYYTGKLPADPLARLFSTVSYARAIVFAEEATAVKAIDKITAIHQSVETARGSKIPDWAYRDVLFMLIDYSIRSFELLERPLNLAEKEEAFNVFYRVGQQMKLEGLPSDYASFNNMRGSHLQEHLYYGAYTKDLFKQYRKHLGFFRYRLLLETQNLITPHRVRKLLGHQRSSILKPIIYLYKISRNIHLDWLLKELLLPSNYKADIKNLDRLST